MAHQSAEVVWQRRVDHEKHRRNLRMFWLFYGLPAGLIILVGGLIEGPGGAAGLAILLGLLGSMIFVAVWLTGRSKAANPTISREDSTLVWATRRVPIDQVRRFSTFIETRSMSMVGVTGSHTSATAEIGTARFILADGSEVDFAFPHLDEEQLEQMRGALEVVLPGKWTSVADLHKR